jgi:hypothetical protein
MATAPRHVAQCVTHVTLNASGILKRNGDRVSYNLAMFLPDHYISLGTEWALLRGRQETALLY